MTIAISVCSVSQSYRQGFWLKRKSVLRELSFDVRQGAAFGLIGANGAGKTTLIRLMAGIAAPEEGEVLIQGMPATGLDARRLIGFLPERPYFHGFLTGGEFLETMAALSGVPRASRPALIGKALDLVSLSHVKDQRLSTYSKGMLQRIGIAQAVLHDPPILILDEPMSGLDPLWRRSQRELISRLSAEGKTIVFTSHSLEDVERLCDSAGMIQDEAIILKGSEAWPETGVEVLASGIGEDAVLRCRSEQSGAIVTSERTGVRIVLPAGEDPGPFMGRLLREGARIRGVHSAPMEWNSPNDI